MLSVVTVDLLRVSSVNSRWGRGLMEDEDCSLIMSDVPKVEKRVVLLSRRDSPKEVLG